MVRQVALTAIPAVLLTATLLWRSNCAYFTGLGLYLLFVPMSAALGTSLAWALTGVGVRRARLWLVGLGLVVAGVVPLAVLKTHPQLFVYNPVFGGVLGPIYDVEPAIRPGLFAHRAVTLGWVGLFAIVGFRAREHRRHLAARWTVAGVLVLGVLGIAYAAAVPLGFLQTEASLRRHLSATDDRGAIVVHADPGVSSYRLARIADEAEYRLARVAHDLDLQPSAPVHVYVYPDPETKARLIGSRSTSVVPVWLSTPQIHLLDERVDGDLGHELVHVLAREVGGRWTGATTKVGLVEGLAVALEPPSGLPSPEAQTVAALGLPADEGGLPGPDGAVVAAMSPLGFWTARGGVAYSVSGAFAAWLLDESGPEALKRVYGGASWEDAYGQSLPSLAAAWRDHLQAQEPTPSAVAYAAWRFSQPSLFEVACPHHVPEHVRLAREALDHQERGQFETAADAASRALAASPDSLTGAGLAATWGRLALAAGHRPETVAARLAPYAFLADAPWTLHLTHADALRLGGRGTESERTLNAARDALPPYATLSRDLLAARREIPPDNLLRVLRAYDAASARQQAEGLAMESRNSVFASLLWAQGERPGKAWEAAQSGWGLGDTAALLRLRAGLARSAGALDDAEALAQRAARASAQERDEPGRRLAADVLTRVRWERSRERGRG